MTDELVQTPNGTFITKEDAEAAGLELPKAKAPAKRKPAAKRSTTTKAKAPAKRKPATTRKGK